MVKELKTLKDLCKQIDKTSFTQREFANDLKAEAVKWVKEFQLRCEPTTAINFIDFFNLTEADLKEGVEKCQE